MKTSALLTSSLLLLASLAQAKDWYEPDIEYDFNIESVYMSRAKVYEDRPILSNFLSVDWDIDKYGRLGFWYYNYCALTGRCQDKYHRFVPEQDWALTYEYDWKFAAEWSLDTEIMVEWQTFHGEKEDHTHSSFEWRIQQQLKNPYITPYYKGRFTLRPTAYNYWQFGLKRKFRPFASTPFSITPNVAVDLCDRPGVRKRFGDLEDGEGDYQAGFLSAIGDVTFEYEFTEWFAVHVKVGQYGVINNQGRGNIHSPNKRDLTFWKAGFTLRF